MFSALLDTCVLVPSRARDVLLEIASTGAYRPLGSTEILAELAGAQVRERCCVCGGVGEGRRAEGERVEGCAHGDVRIRVQRAAQHAGEPAEQVAPATFDVGHPMAAVGIVG
ncbi:hypothetical protein BL253_24970 [Pseudofrankia asymbiotica]|uniref:PIN domain-containing protein n=1 Tax=Pseudofrankia asymbiotica TaxID=1834516 RepID=A0A1V2I7D8_9ACTN|nr:hypothetical protein BL253_24970 [Pseudofrankia asymbiotica]